MKKLTQQQVAELKRQAAPITFASSKIDKIDIDLLDARIVQGFAVIWNERSETGNKFLKGAFAKSIQEHGPGSNSPFQIKFLNQHKEDDPLSVFDVLEEQDQGLFFRTKPLDPIPSADRLLVQLKSGTINNFSQGFNYIWDKTEWDDTDESIVSIEAKLFEISPVSIPAGLNTYRMQSLADVDTLYDDIDYFIQQLPRKHQVEARKLFAQQKSLITAEPPIELIKKALKEEEPAMKRQRVLHYLTQNL